MYSGYLLKRNSSSKAPPMKRVYCSLWGTLLLDFDTEDDAKTSLSPKCVLELIGVSKWDGQIGSTKYDHGLLVVSHIGTTYYLSVNSLEEKNEWITYIRSALECNFANASIIEFRPSKACFDPPSPVGNLTCPLSGTTVATAAALTPCSSCGRGLTPEHLNECTAILQTGQESILLKVCTSCSDAQACLLWLKKLLNLHTLLLHERTPEVLHNINRYKASFKLRRNASTRLDMAASLREQESVTDDEFEELRRVDYEYRQEHMLFEFDRMKDALEVLGNDMQSMLGFLRNPGGLSGTQNGTLDNVNGSLKLYFLVVLRLVTLADVDPDLIDFYWPQIIHIHLLLSRSHQSPSSLGMVDLLQQGLLAIALKYPQLAVKLSWALLAAMGDYEKDKSITQTQYAACVCLLLQLEVHTYGVASCLTGMENSSSLEDGKAKPKSILISLLQPASHQKQELVIELYTLIRIRRMSHTVHNREMLEAHSISLRKQGTSATGHGAGHGEGLGEENAEGHGHEGNRLFSSASAQPFSSTPFPHSADGRLHCVDLFLDNFNERHHHTAQTSDQEKEEARYSGTVCSDNTEDSEPSKDSNSGDSNGIVRQDDSSANFAQKIIWQGLSDQLDWVEGLTDLVDTLRFVDRPARSETLKAELNNQFCRSSGELLSFALDPTSVAGEPMYRMKRIFVEETRVFRTKARAPSLLVFEVERWRDDSGDSKDDVGDGNGQKSKHRGGSFDTEGRNRSRTQTMDESQHSRENADEKVDVTQILEDKMQATISTIHRVEEERHREEGRQAEGVDADTLRRSSSDNDLVEAAALLPSLSQPLRSQSTADLSNRSSSEASTPRSRRLSTTGNYNAITKVDFQRDKDALMNSEVAGKDIEGAVAAGNTEDNEDDDFIEVFRIPDDVPEEEKETSEKVINSAVKLLNSGLITKEEYNQLVDSNVMFRNEAKTGEAEVFQTKVEGFFGVDWEVKKQQLLGSGSRDRGIEDNVHTNHDDKVDAFETAGAEIDIGVVSEQVHASSTKQWPERDLRCFIVKSNDDLRQEVACIQLIELCQEIFADCNLGESLWLKPYRIVSTGPAAGFVETLPNTLSIDAIKKTDNFVSLPNFFKSLYGSSTARLESAQTNFVKSLAAYSLVSYILGIKDRHNGNILIDQHGHVIHIDFGFLLGIAPGGSFSIESAPFKLTEEMLDVFGGIDSDLFSEFVKAFTQGFLALRSKSTAILSAVSLIASDSSFPCFQGKDTVAILDKLKGRFKCEMSSSDAIEHCLELIIASYSSLGTRQYDSFQWYTNGIIP